MRRCAAVTAIVAWASATPTSAQATPTTTPSSSLTAPRAQGSVAFVNYIDFAPLQRAVSCPSNYFSCEDQGSAFTGVCCRNGQQCALDSNNQAACCPQGNVCTGAAPSATGSTSVSYVSNTYFSFPYVATSFSDSGACSAAVNQCSANYQACTADLAGSSNGYGVTIVVPGGGGTTVAPTGSTYGLATATSVCQSLSQQACHGLQNSQCTQTGSHNGFYVGTGAAARPTAACMAGVLAGVGIGIVGGHL